MTETEKTKVLKAKVSNDNNLMFLQPRKTHISNATTYRNIIKNEESPRQTYRPTYMPRLSKIIHVKGLDRTNTSKNLLFGKRDDKHLKLEDFKYLPLNSTKIEIVDSSPRDPFLSPLSNYAKDGSIPVRKGKRVFNPLPTPTSTKTTENTLSEITLEGENEFKGDISMTENAPESFQNEEFRTEKAPESKAGNEDTTNQIMKAAQKRRVVNEDDYPLLEDEDSSLVPKPRKLKKLTFLQSMASSFGISGIEQPRSARSPLSKRWRFDLGTVKGICDEHVEPEVKLKEAPKEGNCGKCIVY